MSGNDCAHMELLLQADHDGELDVGATATLAAHLQSCAHCQARQAELARLSARLRREAPYHAAPAQLRQRIEAAIGLRPVEIAKPPPRRKLAWPRLAVPFGLGAAVAAAMLLLVVLPRSNDLTDAVVASHIRALQPGHLADVASSNQHTVKPWFDGRLDYAPPVKDLAAQDFPLIGGRLDYLDGRPVAALAYRHGLHIIDLYIWPAAHIMPTTAISGTRNGYHFRQWSADGMEFWAVSDVASSDLEVFADDWRRSP